MTCEDPLAFVLRHTEKYVAEALGVANSPQELTELHTLYLASALALLRDRCPEDFAEVLNEAIKRSAEIQVVALSQRAFNQ